MKGKTLGSASCPFMGTEIRQNVYHNFPVGRVSFPTNLFQQ